MDTPRRTRSGAKFSPYGLDEQFTVFKTPIDLSQPLQDAFDNRWAAEQIQEQDDAEGCPLDSNPMTTYSVEGYNPHEDNQYPPSGSPSHLTQPSVTSTYNSSSLSKKDARKKEYRRKKKKQTRERDRAKLEHSLPSPKFKVRSTLSQKLSNLAHMQVHNNVADLRAAKGAWVGIRGGVGRGPRSLDSLLEEGYQYKSWDGLNPFVITDEEDRIFVIFAGRPQDPTYETDRLEADVVLQATRDQLQYGGGDCQVLPRPTNGCAKNRRGNFKTANVGISYGGGQKAPGNLCHTKNNREVLCRFFQQPCIRRLANFANSAFSFFAPKLHEFYRKNLDQLWQHNPHFKHNVPRNVFPAASINFGPEAVSYDHLDHNNLAGGLCSVTAGGNFDPTKGGHIYLVDLRLVVEFPPGSTILIPSSIIRHGNVPIQTGETRTSFTQYAAGGLFRWVEYGFKTWDQFWETDREHALAELENRSGKWKDFLALFSRVNELRDDHIAVKDSEGLMSTKRSKKKKKVAPTLHVHNAQEEITSVSISGVSQDGRRVRMKTSTATLPEPEQASSSGSLDATSSWDDPPPIEIHHELSDAVVVAKRPAKRYENSDAPLKTFKIYRQEYCDEVVRLDGRGLYTNMVCKCGSTEPTIRCKDCHGLHLQCLNCTREYHGSENPLHHIEKWNGSFFETTTLYDIGVTVSLGHPLGITCAIPLSRTITVLHTNGIHRVRVNFCGCQFGSELRTQLLRFAWWPATPLDPRSAATFSVLRQFQYLNLQGNITAYDFYRGLELQTDGRLSENLPDRLQSWMTMIREWRNVKSLKRAGRVHHADGVEATSHGELAIRCRACPDPCRNLLPNWKENEKWSYLYWLSTSQDANFRYKGRQRDTKMEDISLSSGWSYFVEHTEYIEHVKKYANQEEISTCAGFQAMHLANLKKRKGLNATGLVGVACSDHEMWRPNGLGDLQVGERYCNMDYVFLSSIVGVMVLLILASYDIACQFFTGFPLRVPHLPKRLQPLIPLKNIIPKIPKAHIYTHNEKCHGPYSFNWTKGAGRTDGEGIERLWAILNKAALSVREMTPSARRETIDDLCGFINWCKLVNYGDFFQRRLIEALKEALDTRAEYEGLDKSLREENPNLVAEWDKLVLDFDKDKSKPCPYLSTNKEIPMASVIKRLAEDEAASGRRTLEEGSYTAFILFALDIERLQASVRAKVRKLPTNPSITHAAVETNRSTLRRKLKTFWETQDVLMPRLNQHIPINKSLVSNDVESIAIYLPSKLTPSTRNSVCESELVETETAIREAQLRQSLDDLRRELRARMFANKFKTKNITGNRYMTRARDWMKRIDEKVLAAKHEYQEARSAYLCLKGHGSWEEQFKDLKDEDVRGINERALSEQERQERKAAREAAGLDDDELSAEPMPDGCHPGERNRQPISWIWYTFSTGRNDEDENSPRVHEGIYSLMCYDQYTEFALLQALRIEWARSRARVNRWEEQVCKTVEAMRRVLQYTESVAKDWDERASPSH
ncbi:hypothetical protein QCA50_020636 [Cerrena zonata]|uniref:CxC2-like cysteine cluster KDZ transposase-associated domain-containing protein n=1 Tax=Cerrena zonata TaxID=2478898 RepID=A0AAW0F7U5_9APHY